VTSQTDPARDAPRTGVVALDGPSGTGKSTVARLLAQRLGYRYLDTGAMYRAATVAAVRAGALVDSDAAGVPAETAGRIAALVTSARIDITTDPAPAVVLLNGEDVSAEIRSAHTTALVSVVSAIPAVRATLVAAQQDLIGTGAIVVEGRDIGTVVWPSAQPKVFLTASALERATRRAAELDGRVDVAAVQADLGRRDAFDSSRAASPLAAAPGSIELDTTGLSIDDVVDRLVALTLESVVTSSASVSR
jgi:cytidylate kinase